MVETRGLMELLQEQTKVFLGNGSFAQCYLVKDEEGGTYVLRYMKKSTGRKRGLRPIEDKKQRVTTEAEFDTEICACLDDENGVMPKMYGAYKDKEGDMLITAVEFCRDLAPEDFQRRSIAHLMHAFSKNGHADTHTTENYGIGSDARFVVRDSGRQFEVDANMNLQSIQKVVHEKEAEHRGAKRRKMGFRSPLKPLARTVHRECQTC